MNDEDGQFAQINDLTIKQFQTGDENLKVPSNVFTQRQIGVENEILLKQFRELIRHIPGGLFQVVLKPDGKVQMPFFTEHLRKLFDLDAEDLETNAEKFLTLVKGGPNQGAIADLEASAKDFSVWSFTYLVESPKLGSRWLQGSASPIQSSDGSVVWHGYASDVTERRIAEERVRLLARVFEVSHEGIAITDSNGEILEVNAAFTRLTGYTSDEASGMDLMAILAEESDTKRAIRYKDSETSEPIKRGQISARDKDGAVIPLLFSLAQVHDPTGRIAHYALIVSDISDLKNHEEELEKLALHDTLTGLPNRRLMMRRLEAAISESRRTKESFIVCMIDLDGFKEINDTRGHDAGDELLIEIARRLQRIIQLDDTVVRLGGDEFVLILQKAHGEKVYHRILETVHQPVELSVGTVQVTASIGIALYGPEEVEVPGDILRRADQALYQRKRNGKNGFTFHAQIP